MKNKRKIGSVIITSILICMFFNAGIVTGDTGWLDDWSYRKLHVIDGSAGAGTDYQIMMIVHYGGGADSGNNVYVSFLCKTDFTDLRFTQIDGITPLSYWKETYVSGINATFWVKVTGNLDSDIQIYVYFGNSDADSTSSISDTFIRDINSSQMALALDENAGIYTYDKSGNGNNGALSGVVLPTWTTGRYGNGLFFTENSINYSYLQNINAVNLPNNATDDWTMSMWIYPSPQAAFMCLSFGSVSPGVGGIRSIISFTNELYFWGSSADFNTYQSFASGWQHIVITCDSGTSILVYMNGGYIAGGSLSPNSLSESSPSIWTFARKDFAPFLDYYIGKVDELRIYDKMLSQNEITDLYANYGYDTLNYQYHTLIRKYVSPEPINGLWGNIEKVTVEIDNFEYLMFGEGRYLGLLLIILIVVIISMVKKAAGVLTVPVLLFLAFQYLTRDNTEGDLIWFAIACFILLVYEVWDAVR